MGSGTKNFEVYRDLVRHLFMFGNLKGIDMVQQGISSSNGMLSEQLNKLAAYLGEERLDRKGNPHIRYDELQDDVAFMAGIFDYPSLISSVLIFYFTFMQLFIEDSSEDEELFKYIKEANIEFLDYIFQPKNISFGMYNGSFREQSVLELCNTSIPNNSSIDHSFEAFFNDLFHSFKNPKTIDEFEDFAKEDQQSKYENQLFEKIGDRFSFFRSRALNSFAEKTASGYSSISDYRNAIYNSKCEMNRLKNESSRAQAYISDIKQKYQNHSLSAERIKQLRPSLERAWQILGEYDKTEMAFEQTVCAYIDKYFIQKTKSTHHNSNAVSNSISYSNEVSATALKIDELIQQGFLGNNIPRDYDSAKRDYFTKDIFEGLTKDELFQLGDLVYFFYNQSNFPLLGYYLDNTLMKYAVYHGFCNYANVEEQFRSLPISFRSSSAQKVLDSDIAWTILTARHQLCDISFNYSAISSGKSQHWIVFPIMITCEQDYGRQYLFAYAYKERQLQRFRLDQISDVKLTHVEDTAKNKKNTFTLCFLSHQSGARDTSWEIPSNIDEQLAKYYGDAMLYSWNIARTEFSRKDLNVPKLYNIVVHFTFPPKQEQYYVSYIYDTGRHGTLTHTGSHTYDYSIRIADFSEIIPWVRQFGPFAKVDYTNSPELYLHLKNDLADMLSPHKCATKTVINNTSPKHTSGTATSIINKYQSKCIFFLTNYINSCIDNKAYALTKKDFKAALNPGPQILDSKLVASILNEQPKDEDNLFILFNEKKHVEPNEKQNESKVNDNNGLILPIRTTKIIIRTNFVERAWLHYVLDDTKSDLFFSDSNTIRKLNTTLVQAEDIEANSPLLSKYIDIRRYSMNDSPRQKHVVISAFKQCRKAYQTKQPLVVSGADSQGTIISNRNILIYRLEYDSVRDRFAVLGYDYKTTDLLHLYLDEITLTPAKPMALNEYNKLESEAQHNIQNSRKKITISITNIRNGFDRCSYTLSGFERSSKMRNDNEMEMTITYYPFQYRMLLEKLLFLGVIVTVEKPAALRKEMQKILSETYMNYEN